jgi:hypothetical protein
MMMTVDQVQQVLEQIAEIEVIYAPILKLQKGEMSSLMMM